MLKNSNEDKVIVVPLSVLEKKDKNAINENSVLLSALNDKNKIIKSISIEENQLQISYTDDEPKIIFSDYFSISKGANLVLKSGFNLGVGGGNIYTAQPGEGGGGNIYTNGGGLYANPPTGESGGSSVIYSSGITLTAGNLIVDNGNDILTRGYKTDKGTTKYGNIYTLGGALIANKTSGYNADQSIGINASYGISNVVAATDGVICPSIGTRCQ